jgi:dihydrofolate reductase
MRELYLIAAVGNNGEIGLDGRMPWKDKEDLRWFREQTMGHHVIMGPKTFDSVADKLDGRTCWRWENAIEPDDIIKAIKAQLEEGQKIWVAGGYQTYTEFMPYVRHSIITHIDYDGPADTFMPELWETEDYEAW